MPDLLLEIGLEEVPARMIGTAEDELRRRVADLLLRERLLESATANAFTTPATYAAKSYSTPRRLAVCIQGVDEQQADITEEVTGPAVKIAFKDGVPTPAAEAFARRNGVTVGELKSIATPKGDYLAAGVVKKGRSAAEVLAAELPKEIAALYWAKNMYWRPGKPERFVRPVLWLACLLGDEVVPITFAGKTAGRATYGHRILSNGEPFEIQSPASYLAQLEGEYVLADVEARRHKIRKALDHTTRTVPGLRWREDHALVDAVTHLTEWPDVLLGSFEPAYLELPEEVLVTVMRDHQKYFAVELAKEPGEGEGPGAPHLDSETWEPKNPLAPYFLTVTNIALDETNTPIIRQGNERVLRARFNDARFFWDFDQKITLRDRVKLLENVTFQKDLGSYAKKSERVLETARILADLAEARSLTINVNALMDAARLAKTDLTTELVKEFTELQGIIGGLYFKTEAEKTPLLAEQKGRVEITWQAIYDQYLPASAKDRIPRSPEGCILGLADRIDTITGMFSLGMEPTGSKDPFALRRAANAIVRILAESSLPLKLSEVIKASSPSLEVEAKITAFFAERVDFYLREMRGNAYDVVKSVMAPGYNDLRGTVARAQAVTAMRGSDDFLAVSASFKRMKNIVSQANYQPASPLENEHEISYADQPATELNLWGKFYEINGQVSELAQHGNYLAALQAIATVRPEVDAFFENVMVMDTDLSVRERRLLLLYTLLERFSNIADFSEIVPSA